NVTDAVEMGLLQASEELAESTSRSAKALDVILKLNQFQRIDQLGKTITLNAAFEKYTRLARTAKGIEKIRQQYGQAFGDDFAQLVDDLINRRITQNTKILMWAELARTQPTSKSEMPLKFLEAPNGRLFYMLMSFTLKQLDFVRRNIYNQFKAGHIVEGTKNLFRYSTYLMVAGVASGTVKSWIMGKEVKIEDLPEMAVINFWKNFAASELVVAKMLEAESVTDKAQVAVQGAGDAASLTVPIFE